MTLHENLVMRVGRQIKLFKEEFGFLEFFFPFYLACQ